MRIRTAVGVRSKRVRVKARRCMLAEGPEMSRSRHLLRAYAAIGRSRQAWLAKGIRAGHASSRQLRKAGRRLAFPGPAESGGSSRAELAPGQRLTLEVGSWVVLSGLGVGFQLGSWPAWAFLPAIGTYAAWVVLYAEITVQVSRTRARLSATSLQASVSEPA
jgi:hypothetical protein